MEVDSFSKWLEDRFTIDINSRAKIPERKFFSILPDKQLKLLDIGTGLGVNIVYYSKLIDQPINWTALDKNISILEKMHDFLDLHFNQIDNLKWSTGDNTLEVNHLTLDLLKIDQIELSQFDGILANSVFDLLSNKQFIQFINILENEDIPVFFTTNYEGMEFIPMTEEDQYFIDLYDRHMVREQEFGRAMGPNCVEEMIQIMEQRAYNIIEDDNVWYLNNNHKNVSKFILNFMRSAVSELIPDDSRIDSWYDNKLGMINSGKLIMKIWHKDILGV